MRVTPDPQQVREAFAAVAADPSFAESRRLADAGAMPVEMLQAMAMRPEILRAFAMMGPAVYPGGLLKRPLKELVILQASVANACQFCTDSHVAMIKQLGFCDHPVNLLNNPAALPPRTRLALEYTKAAMTDSNRVSEELFGRLKQAFSDPEIVELTFLIGLINMLNLFNNSLQVTYRDEYARA